MLFFVYLLFVSEVVGTPSIFITDNHFVTIDEGTLEEIIAIDDTSRELNLSNSNIHKVSDGALKNRNLVYLSLANNHLQFLPEFAFRLLRKLEYLSLANNELCDLRFAFGGLHNLIGLDISNNGLRNLHAGSFYGLATTTMIMATGNLFGNNFDLHEPKNFEKDSTVLLSLCMVNGTVWSLKVFDGSNDVGGTAECTKRIRPMKGTTVSLLSEGITGFREGWYRLHRLNVNSLTLQWNEITKITTGMLNDLPKQLTRVDLSLNYISVLTKGIINNNYLLTLDLRDNKLRKIESGALKYANNLEILLN